MDDEGRAGGGKRPSVLTIDRAAFLLLRVKRAFKKKRQQRKEKNAAAAAAATTEASGVGGVGGRRPPPLLRSRTLPAIVVPGLSILHAQIDPHRANDLCSSQVFGRGLSTHRVGGVRSSARVSFTGEDDGFERRKSTSSRIGTSPRPSIAEERGESTALRVPTPRGSVSSTGSGASGPGARLARLLVQGPKLPPETPRRLSWERRDSCGQLPRSASIDSVVEAVYARRAEPPAPAAPRADRALSLVSPAVGRRAKAQRGQAGQSFVTVPNIIPN